MSMFVQSFLSIAVLVLLTGCGERADKPASQALARVNGADVTVHQLNLELQRLGPQGAAADAVTRRRVLESLIDQQIVVQRALAAKLDRDPQVVQALDQMRRQVLSQAWLDRQAARGRPSPDEIAAFYNGNPDLFQKRKVYSFREFTIERTQLTDALRERLDKARSPTDITAVLRGANIAYRDTNSVRAAEQLPIEALPRLATMGRGDVLVIAEGAVALVLQVVDSNEQPVTLEKATPIIEQYIVNARRREGTMAKVRELRASAKVEYLQGSGSAVVPAPDAGTKGAPEQAGTLHPADNKDFLQKGLQGLR